MGVALAGLGAAGTAISGSAYAVRGTPVTTRSFIQINIASVRQSVELRAYKTERRSRLPDFVVWKAAIASLLMFN
jgi:hypothetical protein